MQIIQQFTTKNQTYTNPKKITIKGIVLHSTGTPQPKASAYINAFNSPNVQKSVHAFIEPNGAVYQTLPWDYKAWHVGGSLNATHIGIEMCEPNTIKYTGGANWIDNDPEATKATVMSLYKHTVELFAYLCKEFNLNPLEDGVIVSHYEAHQRGKGSGHVDPKHLWDKFGLTMDQFRFDVAKAKSSAVVITPPTETTTQKPVSQYPCLMQVDSTKVEKGDSLNVRNSPNGTIIYKLGRGFIMGVESVTNGWAKLIGGGYCAVKYMKKYESPYILEPKTFLVEILADSLNVRNKPTTIGSTIVGSVPKRQKYTIVATFSKGSWGLLKSGAGFISLNSKYVKRL